ncbi:AMP-binding protein [Nocardia sp. KC 131]|uniref:AMP-binding protein n=1 Tax=Nocardia arseniciresistens TaxID=3392119 RepID=UPI00398E74C1
MLTMSAHIDTFCRDNLPPAEHWPEFVTDLPALRYPDRLNCAVELLDRTIERFGPDHPCLIDADRTWTYGEVLDLVDRIARVLVEELAIVTGNRVLLRGPNTAWLVACWLAVVKAGAVVVTTMPLLRAVELTKLVSLTKPAAALCDHRFRDEIDTVAADFKLPVVSFGAAGPGDLGARAAQYPGGFAAVDTAADDVVLLAPTSGTTGAPKATMHFHRDVLAIADTFSAHVVAPRRDDIFVGTPPIAFTFGLGGLVIFPMRVGASTVLVEKPTQADLAEAIHKNSATVLFTAPTAYRALLRDELTDRLSSLRRCVSAGEHLPVSVSAAFFEATGLRIIDGIGGTELLHVFISAAESDIRPGSTGKEVPGFRAEIQDASGNPVPDGTPGALAVKGPTGCRYLADARQRSYVRNGWNMTGDTYTRDSDGHFWYHGRSDDMIVSSGYNIGAPEVESVLDGHPDVAECAVVGLPDPERGTIVHAAIVLRPGVRGDAAKIAEIQTFAKRAAAPYKYPRGITFVDALPRTDSGKLQRFKVRQLLLGDTVTAMRSAHTETDQPLRVPGRK